MVADGYKKTEIGVLPVEWEVVELRDIGKVSMCKRVMKDETTDCGEIPFYKIGTFGKEADSYINQELYEDYKAKYSFPKQGDILISASGTIGRLVIYNGEPAYFQDSNIVWVDNQEEKLLNSLLFYIYKTVKWNTDGNTIARLYNENLRRIKIPLPSLKEQEKIADILSTTDDKIDAIASQIEKAQTLKKGLLQKLLSEGIGHSEFKDSELGKIPESWEIIELNDLCSKIVGGGTPNSKIDDYWKNGTIYWATVKDMDNSKYLSKTQDTITELGLKNSSANLIPANSIITATRMGLGRFFINTVDIAINQDLKALVLKEMYDKNFIFWSLISKSDLILSLGTGTTVKGIRLEEFRSIKFTIPALEEQKQIANILSTADEKLEVLRAKKDKYETLKKGLLQKLLSGEVRV